MGEETQLFVSKVVQKAIIEVNEKGSKAAAATYVECTIYSATESDETPQFNCNRPFLFLIKDNLSGLILFSGRIEDASRNYLNLILYKKLNIAKKTQ